MKKIIIVPLILILLIGGIIGSLYVRIWDPVWNPFRPVPQVVLAEMALKMSTLKTVHADIVFSVETQEEKEDKSIVVITSSDTNKTDSDNPKSKGEIEVKIYSEGIKLSVEAETVAIGRDTYFRLATIPFFPFIKQEAGFDIEGIKNQWIRIGEEDLKEAFGENYISLEEERRKELIERLTKLLKGKEFYRVKEELPDEEIEGQMAYHYLLILDKEEVKDLIPEMFEIMLDYAPEVGEINSEEKIREASEKISGEINNLFEKMGDVTFDVWIGQKDGYLHRAKFEKEINISLFGFYKRVEDKESARVLVSGEFNFSNFNEKVEIDTPKDYKSIKEIIEMYFRGTIKEIISQ